MEVDRYMRILLIASVVAGCNGVSQYDGDGVLVDQGRFAATDRYVLELGTVNLGQSNVISYRISGLPEANYVVGFEVPMEVTPDNTRNIGLQYPIVSVSLRGSKGQIVFASEGRLDHWTWAVPAEGEYVFVYDRDRNPTYFDVLSGGDQEFQLVVQIQGNGQSDIQARILAKSGGWK